MWNRSLQQGHGFEAQLRIHLLAVVVDGGTVVDAVDVAGGILELS